MARSNFGRPTPQVGPRQMMGQTGNANIALANAGLLGNDPGQTHTFTPPPQPVGQNIWGQNLYNNEAGPVPGGQQGAGGGPQPGFGNTGYGYRYGANGQRLENMGPTYNANGEAINPISATLSAYQQLAAQRDQRQPQGTQRVGNLVNSNNMMQAAQLRNLMGSSGLFGGLANRLGVNQLGGYAGLSHPDSGRVARRQMVGGPGMGTPINIRSLIRN